MTVETFGARSWPEPVLADLFAEGFPDFITADREVKRYIGRVREEFGAFDLVLVDGEVPVATGWGVPIAWHGTVADLPVSFADVLRRALECLDRSREGGGRDEADTLVVCGAVVHPERKGTGAAADLLTALRDCGHAHGLTRVVAPVRPTRKHLYPLASGTAYAGWTRDDGLPFDPWLRLHVRLGGRVLATAETAQTMTGTVAEWEAWTGLALPASGDYVIPQGLGVLHVDRERDLGTYSEPNVWVRHT